MSRSRPHKFPPTRRGTDRLAALWTGGDTTKDRALHLICATRPPPGHLREGRRWVLNAHSRDWGTRKRGWMRADNGRRVYLQLRCAMEHARVLCGCARFALVYARFYCTPPVRCVKVRVVSGPPASQPSGKSLPVTRVFLHQHAFVAVPGPRLAQPPPESHAIPLSCSPV